jgi:hypothetical protein
MSGNAGLKDATALRLDRSSVRSDIFVENRLTIFSEAP